MRFAIIGAGMAGLSCGQALQGEGHDVVLFDKGRGPGGRMSTRRMDTPLGEASFDHGAQYFTARDEAFSRQVAEWADKAIVAPWPAAGSDAWVGRPAMNAPIRAMADKLDVRWNVRIDCLSHERDWHVRRERIDDGPFDGVIVAVPAEQVAALVEVHDPAAAVMARSTTSDPCWMVMAAFENRLPIDDDVIKDAGAIGWAARNSAKPCRVGPEAWVVQATPIWSRDHLEDDGAVVEQSLLDSLATALGGSLPKPIASSAHRWRFAKSGALGSTAYWNADLSLGLCGDWLVGPRVEGAWLSGAHVAQLANSQIL